MENSVENLYLTIAQSIVNSIDDDWSISVIRAELTEGSIEFQSEYIPTLSPEQPKYFDVPFEIFEAFEELHAVTIGTELHLASNPQEVSILTSSGIKPLLMTSKA